MLPGILKVRARRISQQKETPVSTKTILVAQAAFSVLIVSAALLCQTTSATRGSSAALEFPVTMRRNVVAGATAVGTRVEAKLTVATLVNGAVVPKDAIFSGEVTESEAKSVNCPSRLSIYLDAVRWKNGSTPRVLQLTQKVYLTSWYYAAVTQSLQQPSDDNSLAGAIPVDTPPAMGHRKNTRTNPPYSDPGHQTFPAHDPDRKDDTSSGTSNASQRRVLMKNVESTRNSEGATLTCKHSNIKLDRTTTYVFAPGGAGAGPG